MKNFKLSTLVTLFALALFVIACGEQGTDNDADTETTSQTDENTQTEATTEETSTDATDKSGKEYTSAFVCPMNCKGSGSHEAGKCPSCGMDYVANADFKSEGEGDHEGHDHE